MSLKISDEDYKEILEIIESDESPVGIDAGKTHVLILHKLMKIEERLSILEKHVYREE